MQTPRRIYIHDDWDSTAKNYDADVSLLEFWPGKIPFDNFIQPICLWGSEVEPTVAEGLVTGWGRSEDTTRLHENIPKLVNALTRITKIVSWKKIS